MERFPASGWKQNRWISQHLQKVWLIVANKTLDSLKKNKNITVETLEKLCRLVGCTPNDVVHFSE
ncbi:helix-turn-helix domain-containing protein [Oscillibacter ruminantium]|uniref:helix-turn-helix domain-containing protein n=1 Tax=Oscillibacter ruminantium TaxID=1263547 RepID=UPI0009D96518|nr:helix-turn-helix domain-containing protein [Oscillibacter ruminantium]